MKDKIDKIDLARISQKLDDFKEEIIPKLVKVEMAKENLGIIGSKLDNQVIPALDKIEKHLENLNGRSENNANAIIKIAGMQKTHSYVIKTICGILGAVLVGLLWIVIK